jgi:hypothetical protein
MDETDNTTTVTDGEQSVADIDPIDVQHLLTWYFDVVHPGRHHITSASSLAALAGSDSARCSVYT